MSKCDFDTLDASSIEYIGATALVRGGSIRGLPEGTITDQVIVTPTEVYTFRGPLLPIHLRSTLAAPDSPLQAAFADPDGVTPRELALSNALTFAEKKWTALGSLSYDDYQTARRAASERNAAFPNRLAGSYAPNGRPTGRQRQQTADPYAAGA